MTTDDDVTPHAPGTLVVRSAAGDDEMYPDGLRVIWTLDPEELAERGIRCKTAELHFNFTPEGLVKDLVVDGKVTDLGWNDWADEEDKALNQYDPEEVDAGE